MLLYVKRQQWGGPAAPIGTQRMGAAASLTAHHSQSPWVTVAGGRLSASLKLVKTIHDDHAAKWAGVGYNVLGDQNGVTFEGRGYDRIGAHAGTTEGNRTSLAFCFLLDGNLTTPSDAAIEAFREYARTAIAGGFLRADWKLKFHRDWKATECPGDKVVAALREAVDQRQPTLPVLRIGDRGAAVLDVQRKLRQPARYQTGYFGKITEAAVMAFQQAHGLKVDGVVGPVTWEALLA